MFDSLGATMLLNEPVSAIHGFDPCHLAWTKRLSVSWPHAGTRVIPRPWFAEMLADGDLGVAHCRRLLLNEYTPAER